MKKFTFSNTTPLTADHFNSFVQESQIMQRTGDSRTDVMSQAAVTNALRSLGYSDYDGYGYGYGTAAAVKGICVHAKGKVDGNVAPPCLTLSGKGKVDAKRTHGDCEVHNSPPYSPSVPAGQLPLSHTGLRGSQEEGGHCVTLSPPRGRQNERGEGLDKEMPPALQKSAGGFKINTK